MTTDPRIAALAEALRVWRRVFVDAEDPDRWYTDSAAALLAALPPDWCGHDLRAIRNRAWQDGVNAANVDPDLARLRIIEEAARAVVADYPSDAWPVLNALRAALGSER
jgi:hypothetical protein